MITPRIGLPLVAAGQAQKHVTINEALTQIDRLINCSVADSHLTVPPSAPDEGERYIVADGATGAWAGQVGAIAVREGANWHFYTPQPGWLAWDRAAETLLVYESSGWRNSAGENTLLVETFGVHTTPDLTNRFAVSSHGALLNHAGADHRLTINKSDASATSSLVFQSNFIGAAELGLCGTNDLSFKVGSETGAWRHALIVDRATGRVSFPETPAAAQENLLINGDFSLNQRGFSGGALAVGAFCADRWRTVLATNVSIGVNGVTMTGGKISQTVENAMFGIKTPGGAAFTVSAYNPSGDLVVTLGGTSAVLTAGTGRRAVTLVTQAGFTGNLVLTLAPSAGSVTFADVKLEAGAIATAWQSRLRTTEVALCARYFCKSYSLDVVPANGAAGTGYLGLALLAGLISSQRIAFPASMRAAPLVSFLSGQVGSQLANRWAYYQAGNWNYVSSIYPTSLTTEGFSAEATTSGLTAGSSYIVIGSWIADAEFA